MLTTSNDIMNSMFDVDTRNIYAILALIFRATKSLGFSSLSCLWRPPNVKTEGKAVFPIFVWSNVETDLNWVTWVAGVQRIRCPHRLKYITCSCCLHEAVASSSSFQRMESKQNSSQ